MNWDAVAAISDFIAAAAVIVAGAALMNLAP